MEPFRVFVADKLPEEQRGTGFAMQSFFIGVGAVVADMLPWMLKNWFHVTSDTSATNTIPLNVKIAFYLGAGAFLSAVLWTVFSTKEYPPEDLDAFRRKKAESKGLGHFAGEIFAALGEMPGTMKRLALVQFFTWLGLFCMWLHFSNAVPVVFGSSDPNSDLFKRGAEWAGVCYATKDAVTFVAAFGLMAAARKFDRRRVHGICLALGGRGLLSVGFIHGYERKNFLLIALRL